MGSTAFYNGYRRHDALYESMGRFQLHIIAFILYHNTNMTVMSTRVNFGAVTHGLQMQLQTLELKFLNGDRQMSTQAHIFVPSNHSSWNNSDAESADATEHNQAVNPVREEPQEVKPRLATVGQEITGRLNIHRPKDGTPVRYYINWCNRSRDNLLMPHREMIKCFGSLKPLKVGMYFKVTVVVVPDDRTIHPTGVNPVNVPAPKQNRRERRAQYIKKLRDKQRKNSLMRGRRR